MWKLGMKQFYKNRNYNGLLILQLTVILTVVVSLISVVQSRFDDYAAIKNSVLGKGWLVFMMSLENTDRTFVTTKDEVFQMFEGCESVAGMQVVHWGREDWNTISRLYDDAILENWTPKLKAGRWVAEELPEDQIPEVVVSDYYKDISVGDVIEMETVEGSICPVRVVGILEDNAKIIACEGTINEDYRDLYWNFNPQVEETDVILSSVRQFEQSDVTRRYSDIMLIRFADDITPEMMEKNETAYKNQEYVNDKYDLKDLRDNSQDYIYKQVKTLYPFLCSVALLLVVCAFSVSALSTKKSLRNYSIYYICGNTWRSCLVLNVIEYIMVGMISFVISMCLIAAAMAMGFGDSFSIRIGLWEVTGELLLLLIYMVCYIILPYLIIGKSTPVQILHEN